MTAGSINVDVPLVSAGLDDVAFSVYGRMADKEVSEWETKGVVVSVVI